MATHPAPPSAPRPVGEGHGRLLVAGAAGGLGAHIVAALLAHEGAGILALVRAADDAAALAPVDRALARAGLAPPDPRRLVVIAGNLFDDTLADRLLATGPIEGCYRAHGRIGVATPAAEIHLSNVDATLRLATLADRLGAPLTLASSLAPWVCTPSPPALVIEQHEPDPDPVIGDYAASKLVAERALRPRPVRLVRLGRLTGPAEGPSPAGCRLIAFLRSIAAMGVLPRSAQPLEVDVTPIDAAARAMIALGRAPPGIFHGAAHAPASLANLAEALATVGRPVTWLPLADFLDRCRDLAARGEPAAPAGLGLAARLMGRARREGDLFLSSGVRYDSANADRYGAYSCAERSPAPAPRGGGPAITPLAGSRGLVLGKFLPPLLGHMHLVNFARAFCERLDVVVGTLAAEPIPGALRHQWMTELFPGARVLHLEEELPRQPSESPLFWDLWRTALLRLTGRLPTHVFASEAYGHRLAAELGATFVPADPLRTARAVSGSVIRNDPMGNREFLPRCVRPHFVRRVSVVGPDSTGKSTLARRLAEHFRTVWVPQYARTWLETHGSAQVVAAHMPLIARGQAAAEEALAQDANRVLITDTDPLCTVLWQRALFGVDSPEVSALAADRPYDLTSLCAPGVPWVADPVRYLPGGGEAFLVATREALVAAGRAVVEISGPFPRREARAIEVVQSLVARR